MGIDIEDLCFSYKDKKVLRNINLHFEKGKIYGLLGLNGSGKTTLLKLILGLLKEDQGMVSINEKNKLDYKVDEISKYIAYVPQNLSISYDVTVLDFILMGFNPFMKLFEKPSKNHELEALELLNQMQLSHLKENNLSSLSGGELQMVLIARALIQNTEFIIMDEPVSNLDLKNQRHVLDKIKEISKLYKKAIIISLHDPNLIKKYCDYTILLKDGEVISHGKSIEIINQKNLKKIFDMPFEKIQSTDDTYYFLGV
ncbi:ABC transporter ATP-binding protein [Mycoplasmatota bacterium]|nr:ABC transporter ATP-binding protein [Mycoplasmatota bacterium]